MSNNALPLAQTVLEGRGWDGVMRALMLAGKGLSPLPDTARVPENYIDGCDSDVWMQVTFSQRCVHVLAFSPSKIIRGVLAVVIEKAESLSIATLSEFDFEQYLAELQLHRYLSESRGNGLTRMTLALQQQARAHLATLG